MRSREVIKLIEADGWFKVRQKGSHCHYRHPTKPGTTTVPHPKSEIGKNTLASIEKQSGVTLSGG